MRAVTLVAELSAPQVAVAQCAALLGVLALLYVPLGDAMARLFSRKHHLAPERWIYRLFGVRADQDQSWTGYARSLLTFSAVCVLLLYAVQRAQALLPLSLGHEPVPEGVAFNTAASFVTNTNWQAYAPESTMGHAVQAAGLTVQNFVSAAVGIAVAVALIRGMARRRSDGIGNFWVDMTRACLGLLLPLAAVSALVLVAGGVIQNWHGMDVMRGLTGTPVTVPGGPVASQEAIKNLGTNGGGFFNANGSHPFENPQPWTSFVQCLLILAIPFSLARTFGTMVGDRRQGYAVAAVMGLIFVASYSLLACLESLGRGTAPQLAGAALEGKEMRFGVVGSALFGTSSTLTSTGAVNSMHESYTALGGMMPMLNMMLGEVAPGGVGSGLYGMLVLALLTVFVGGLLVGRTPEYLGKKISSREIKLVSLYILVMPSLVLFGLALSFGIPPVRESVMEESMAATGHHGLSEMIYALTSAANNNGSAFAGLTASTSWLAGLLGVVMLLGRFLPIIFVLALAGSLARQETVPVTSGTLPTHRPLFAGMLLGVTVIVTALTFFPVLTLGPLSEGLK